MTRTALFSASHPRHTLLARRAFCAAALGGLIGRQPAQAAPSGTAPALLLARE